MGAVRMRIQNIIQIIRTTPIRKKNYCEEKKLFIRNKSIDKTFYFQTVALNIGE